MKALCPLTYVRDIHWLIGRARNLLTTPLIDGWEDWTP